MIPATSKANEVGRCGPRVPGQADTEVSDAAAAFRIAFCHHGTDGPA